MLNAFVRNTVFIGAMAIGATLSGLTAHWAISARGLFGPAILQAESVPSAILAAVVSMVICTILAVIVNRTNNPAIGMFALGGGMFGFAWRFATVQELVHSGSLGMLGIETALWAVAVLAATWVLFKIGGPMPDVGPDPDGQGPFGMFSLAGFKAAAAGVLVLPAVWLLAQSPMKGQMVGAVFLGGGAAGLLGRIISPHVQPVLLFASPVLFGALGHVIAASTLKIPAEEALATGTLPHLLLPMPVHYAVGSMMGVAFGLGLAKSSLHQDEPDK